MKTNSLCNIFPAELFKTKRNVGLIIMLGLPVIISMYFFITTWNDLAKISDSLTIGTFFCESYTRNHFYLYLFFYPLIVSFAVFSFNNIEYPNDCTRLVFTLPVKKTKIYLSKIFVLFLYVTCSIVLAYTLFTLSINVLHLLFPELCLQSFEFRDDINILFLRTYVSMIAVMMMQNCLSLLFKNFMIPVSFALFCTIVSIVAPNWKWAFLFPHGGIYKALGWFYQEDLHFFHKEIVAGLICIAVFYVIGFAAFNSNRIHKNS